MPGLNVAPLAVSCGRALRVDPALRLKVPLWRIRCGRPVMLAPLLWLKVEVVLRRAVPGLAAMMPLLVNVVVLARNSPLLI